MSIAEASADGDVAADAARAGPGWGLARGEVGAVGAARSRHRLRPRVAVVVVVVRVGQELEVDLLVLVAVKLHKEVEEREFQPLKNH